MESNIIDPVNDFFREDLVYKIALQPADPGFFLDLERLVETVKEEHESPYEKTVTYNHKDKLIDHCNLTFETVFQPRLEGELREIDNDSQMFGRYVQVVGNLQILPNGNLFLSPHIVEPLQVEEFDPME